MIQFKNRLFLFFLIIRLCMAYITRTWYVPDETWQSVEVAHGIVWPGFGHRTWEWDQGVRSFLHPLIFVPCLYLLKITGLDTPYMVALFPRFFQGFLSAIGDVCNLLVFQRFFSIYSWSTPWFIFIYSSNWFLLYSASRTLVNQLELVLGSCALSLYNPKRLSGLRSSQYISLVVLSFMIRPTSAILWLPLILSQIWNSLWFSWSDLFKTILFNLMPIALLTLAVVVGIDTYFYGKLTIVPWNFFKFNVLEDVSSQYGTNPFHWYITNALPTIFLGPVGLVPLPAGIIQSYSDPRGPPKAFTFSLLWFLVVFSILPHKEYRFLMPIVPLCICYSSYFVAYAVSIKNKRFPKLFIFFTIGLNLPLTAYLSIYHQSGIVQVTDHLANKFSADVYSPRYAQENRVLFLMPCHSGPHFSHFHLANAEIKHLECPPKLSQKPEAIDEAENFYQDPELFLTSNPQLNPTHIVCYDSMTSILRRFLTANNFELCAHFFHTLFPEGKVGSYVHVLCKTTRSM